MYLGIDIGTSSVKTVLFDRDQRLVGQASQGLSVSRPHPGWSEQDPEDWWRGVEATIGTLAREHGLAGPARHRALGADARGGLPRP